MKTTSENGIGGLEYVTIVNIPISLTESGREVISSNTIRACEELVAKTIISGGLPIRGAEVRFLRKCLETSLDEFGKHFDITGAGVKKWEETPLRRLSVPNEIAVRLFLAERLNLNISAKFTDLYRHISEQRNIELDFAAISVPKTNKENENIYSNLLFEIQMKLHQLKTFLPQQQLNSKVISKQNESSATETLPDCSNVFAMEDFRQKYKAEFK